MKDGRTRQIGVSQAERRDGYLARHEVALEKPRLTLGRGPGCDVKLDDASISHQHAALELGSNGYRVRDLGSTNGVLVNGARMALAELKHGDKLKFGEIELRYVV